MSLQNVFKKAAQTIVKAFGDVPVIVTYKVQGVKTFSSETGIVNTPTIYYKNIKMIISSFSSYDKNSDQSIIATDLKALIAVEDLKIKPSANNEITVTSSSSSSIRSGDVFNVIGDFKIDAAEALYKLHLRAVV